MSDYKNYEYISEETFFYNEYEYPFDHYVDYSTDPDIYEKYSLIIWIPELGSSSSFNICQYPPLCSFIPKGAQINSYLYFDERNLYLGYFQYFH